jgi:hypothetical protein
LAEARQKRDDARKQVNVGTGPAHERKMAKIAAQISAGNSFRSVAEDYIQVKLIDSGAAESTVEKARWCTNRQRITDRGMT